MWGPRTLNADDDDDDNSYFQGVKTCRLTILVGQIMDLGRLEPSQLKLLQIKADFIFFLPLHASYSVDI